MICWPNYKLFSHSLSSIRYASVQINPYSKHSYPRVFPLQAKEKALFESWWKFLQRTGCCCWRDWEDLETDQAWLEMKRGLGFQQEAVAEMRAGGLKRQDESWGEKKRERERERGGLNKRENSRLQQQYVMWQKNRTIKEFIQEVNRSWHHFLAGRGTMWADGCTVPPEREKERHIIDKQNIFELHIWTLKRSLCV